MKSEKKCVYLYYSNNEFMENFNIAESFFGTTQYTIRV